MAANGGKINYTLAFQVDKASLEHIKSELDVIKNMTGKDALKLNPDLQYVKNAEKALNAVKTDIKEIDTAFNGAFDSTVGVTNVTKLSQSLKKIDLGKMSQNFNKLGVVGQEAFSKIAKQAMTTNLHFKQMEGFTDKLGQTFMNTVRWKISSTIINTFTGSLEQAYGYVKHLDTSLNDIRIVTNKSAEEMAEFAVQANKAAKALGQSTTNYTEASLIYYQQGLSDEEVAARAETTLKAANVTGQSAKQVSEELTAVWNGYKIQAENTEMAVDKLAAVAATTASNLEELSTGMSKVASTANAMGVDIDQLNAQISTIISTTRQAPESVGTALKTIYARMGDLKLGGEDEDGIKLGDVSGTLDAVGVSVLDVNGNLREMGDVMEDVAEKWQTWTEAQQIAIAEVMAGKRQYNNLIALFENWDKYTAALETSKNATGTLQRQQDIYMESTKAHLQQLKTQWEDLYDSVLDADSINDVADALTKIVSLMTKFIDSMGGGKGLLLGLTTTLTGLFNKQISTGISNFAMQLKNAKYDAASLKAELAITEQYAKNMDLNPDAVNRIVELKQHIQQYYDIMSKEEIQHYNDLVQRAAELEIIRQKEEAIAEIHRNRLTQSAQAQGGPANGTEYTTEELQQAGENSVEALDNVEKAYEKVLKAAQNYADKLKIINEETEGLSKNKTYEAFKGKNENNINERELYKEYQTAAKEYEKFIKEAAEATGLSEAEIGKLTQKLQDHIKDIHTSIVNRQKITNEELGYLKKSATQQSKNLLTPEVQKFKEATAESTEEIVKQNEAMQKSAQEANNYFRSLKEGISAEFSIREWASSFTALASGISSAGFALQSFKSLWTTWSNQDISIFDKITQTMMSFGMILPVVLKGYQTLNTAKGVYNALTVTENVLNGQAVKVTLAKLSTENLMLVAEKALTEEEKEQLLIDNAINGERAESIDKLAREIVETRLLTKAKKDYNRVNVATVQTMQAQTAAVGPLMNRSLSGLKAISTALGPVGKGIVIAGVAVGALTIAISKYINKKREEERKKLLEDTEAQINAYKELKTTVDQAVDSLKGLSDQVKEGTLTQEQFLIKALATVDGLDAQTIAALKAAKSYTELNGVIDDFNKKNLEKGIKETAEGANAIVNDWALNHLVIKSKTGEDITATTITTEQIKELEKSANTDEAKKYVQDLKDIKQYQLELAQINSDLDLAGTFEDGKEAAENYISELMNAGFTEQEAMESLVQYAATIGTDAANEVVDYYTATLASQSNKDKIHGAQIAAGFKDLFDTDETSNGHQGGSSGKFGFNDNLYNKLSYDNRVQESLQKYNINNIDEILPTLDPTILTNYYRGIIDYDQLRQEIVNQVEAASKAADKQLKNDFESGIFDTSDSLQKILSSALKGEDISTNEEYDKLINQLNQIKDLYPELTNEVEVFSNKALVGTEYWTQSVYKLQETIDKYEFDQLNENYSSLLKDIGQINIEANPEKFEDTMEELLAADYAINVEVHSDAERDFENLSTSLNDVETMAGKIGEDFIVAADDLRELNNTFPGILDGMTYLADGTVQLNEEVATSAMDMAQQEAFASTEATTEKLKNSATELRAKATTYEAMANLAYEAADDETKAEKNKNKIVEQLTQIEADNDQIATNAEVENQKIVADYSAETAATNARNWSQSYQEASDAANRWADVAVSAMISAKTGKRQRKDFGATFKGKYKGASEARTTQSAQLKSQDVADIDWTSLGDSYMDMAESLRYQANDIEGMIAELGAKSLKSIDTTGGAGKSKDGSSGSGSGKDADQEEYENYQIDIYHKVNAELEDIEEKLGRIQTIGDHTWGKSQVEVLTQEKELLDENIDKLEEKIELQQKDLSVRKKQLENEGFTFSDDSAVILNREEQIKALWDGYDAMVAQYNAMSADAQESYKATLEAEKDRVQKIADALDKYEDVYGEYQSALDSWLDKQYEIIETQIEAFNSKVEIQLELNQAERDWIDFKKEVIDDIDDIDFGGRIASSLSKLSIYLGSDGEIAELTDHVNESVSEIAQSMAGIETNFSHDGVFDTQAAHDQLVQYRDSLMDAVRAAKEEVDEVAKTYLDALDDAKDKLDKQIEGWEAIGTQIEHDIALIKKVSGEKSYEALARLYDQQHQNNLETIQAERINISFWEQRIQQEKTALELAEEGSVEWKTHNEALEEATENWKDAIEKMNSTVIDALDVLDEWHKSQISSIEDSFDKAMSANIGLDQLEKEWNLVNDMAGRYLDNVERAVEMDGLEHLFDKALNNANLTAAAQQEINKLRDEEFEKLKGRDRLSQYDIDLTKAKLNILQQQLALEEAQKNKSNLRLRRDSQGNYNYQYVGDDAQTEAAEEGLMSAKGDWYQLVKRRNLDLTNEIIQNRKNLSDALKFYAETDWTNDEEGRKKQLEIIALYEQQEKDLQRDTEIARQDFFKGTAQYFADVEDHDILPQWDTTINKMTDQWAKEGEDSFVGKVKKGINDIDSTQDTFATKTQEVLTAAGLNYQTLYNNGIDPTKNKLEQLVDTNEEFSSELDEINNKLEDYADNLKEIEEAYNDLEDAASSAIQSANDMLRQLANTAVDAVNQINNAVRSAASAPSITGYSSSGYGSGSTGSGMASGLGAATSALGGTKYKINLDPNGASGTLAVYKVGAANSSPLFITGVRGGSWSEASESDKEEVKKYLAKKNVTKANTVNWPSFLRTGGYTGTWPGASLADSIASGKLAILHEKELVLNKEDTKNILDAVDVVRDINSNQISSDIINSVISRIAEMMAGVSSIFDRVSNTQAESNNMVYDGDININADFSGVKTADAIYDALVELENYGLQTAYSNLNSQINHKF